MAESCTSPLSHTHLNVGCLYMLEGRTQKGVGSSTCVCVITPSQHGTIDTCDVGSDPVAALPICGDAAVESPHRGTQLGEIYLQGCAVGVNSSGHGRPVIVIRSPSEQQL